MLFLYWRTKNISFGLLYLPMESFLEIPSKNWPQLRELFTQGWPNRIEGYCLMDTLISYPLLIPVFNFKVYCPEGEIGNGMITVSDVDYYQLFICPVDEDTTILENALVNTKVIDWTRDIMVPSANSQVRALVKRVCDKLKLDLSHADDKFCKILMNRRADLLEIGSCPENTYMGPLRPEYIDLVDRTWTFYIPGSTCKIFDVFMKSGLSYVLYSSETNEPLSWIFINEAGTLTHLFCLDEHRKKGYAEYVTRVATNDLLRKGKVALAYTFEENVQPQRLLKKLGYDLIEHVGWLQLTKGKK